MKHGKIANRLHLTLPEIVLITVITVAFGFFSSTWMLRIENTSNPNVFITYWGFPCESIKIENHVGISNIPYDIGKEFIVMRTYEYLWSGILINVIIYITSSTIIVKLAAWIREEIDYHRYYKS